MKQIKQFGGEGESRTLSTKTMGNIYADLEIKISQCPHSSLCRAYPSMLSELYTFFKVLIVDFDKSTGHYGTANLMLKVTNKDTRILRWVRSKLTTKTLDVALWSNC